MHMLTRLTYIIQQTARFLTFKGLDIKSKNDLTLLAIAGIVFAWIAGVGRYWDHPSAYVWQYAGLGSVAYIFVLAAIIWLIVLPIKPERWSYLSVLTFVGLTSPLAWLYAIPVERMTSMDFAISANMWFLAIVAFWRVALYVQFLRKVAKLSGGMMFVITFLPLTAIIISLVTLNLEHAVFEIMAGLEQERTGQELIHDQTYGVVNLLAFLSMLLGPFLFVVYIVACIQTRKERKDSKS